MYDKHFAHLWTVMMCTSNAHLLIYAHLMDTISIKYLPSFIDWCDMFDIIKEHFNCLYICLAEIANLGYSIS